jgi:CO/xanthine dehydrogenase Mo-binding subunit
MAKIALRVNGNTHVVDAEPEQFARARRVTSLDWATYPILRFPDVPAVDVVLINQPELPPLGAGEGATIPPAAAIANAIFDAVGVRLSEGPFTPKRVLAAMQKKT